MRARLRFYLKHAFRSLQRERRRSLFAAFAVAADTTLILVTHDTEIANVADRVLTMKDGVLVS